MDQTAEEIQKKRQVISDLEQYRRLVELQRQMIQLAQENEKAKRECDALREKVSIEVIAPKQSQQTVGLGQRLQQKAKSVFRRIPKTAFEKVGLTILSNGSIAEPRQET